MRRCATNYSLVALSIVGSAILLFSCEGSKAGDTLAADEVMMTEYSEDLSIVESENGHLSYHFITPLVEGYALAREPYREFRKGVKITTFKEDSLSTVDATLTANYAIFYINRQLWEAKGNVVVEKSDGKTLYTQQLFWDQRTKRIYSNVDSKIVQGHGRDVFIGEGFESDQEFKDWRFRRMKGRMEVNVAPTDGADSTANAQTTAGAKPAAGQSAGAKPAGQPVEGQSAGSKAAAGQSVGSKPTAVKPTAEKPIAEKPIAENPAAEKSAVRPQRQDGASDRPRGGARSMLEPEQLSRERAEQPLEQRPMEPATANPKELK